jgi:hypothetical protein
MYNLTRTAVNWYIYLNFISKNITDLRGFP